MRPSFFGAICELSFPVIFDIFETFFFQDRFLSLGLALIGLLRHLRATVKVFVSSWTKNQLPRSTRLKIGIKLELFSLPCQH